MTFTYLKNMGENYAILLQKCTETRGFVKRIFNDFPMNCYDCYEQEDFYNIGFIM